MGLESSVRARGEAGRRRTINTNLVASSSGGAGFEQWSVFRFQTSTAANLVQPAFFAHMLHSHTKLISLGS